MIRVTIIVEETYIFDTDNIAEAIDRSVEREAGLFNVETISGPHAERVRRVKESTLETFTNPNGVESYRSTSAVYIPEGVSYEEYKGPEDEHSLTFELIDIDKVPGDKK